MKWTIFLALVAKGLSYNFSQNKTIKYLKIYNFGGILQHCDRSKFKTSEDILINGLVTILYLVS